MYSFLKHVANHIYDEMNGNFQNTTIVFPNKRATLFFNQYLWEKSNGKTMWTPEYTTISELFTLLSKNNIADPIFLICRLYEVYLQHFPGTEKSFDELYPLLEMMLADFEDVDSNLVPADKIFRNVSELQELTDYSFLEQEQIDAINHFFNGLKWSEETEQKQKFSNLWNKLFSIYSDYSKALLKDDDKMMYEGMLKRSVIESISSDKKTDISSCLSSSTYAFVGFNVLNKAEHELFKFIKQNKQTYFYWDYDMSYCSGRPYTHSRTHGFEAGMFITENIKDFGSAFDSSCDVYKNMSKPKKITFIQSPTENAQSRYISRWVEETIKPGDVLRDSAIVLCNENILQPVLHSIPKTINGDNNEKVSLNVTMGYPLSETPVYSLVQALLELQLRGRTKSNAWRYKQVSAVLKHPYIRRMSGGQANKTLFELTTKNTIFPTNEVFKDHTLFSQIFVHKTGIELTRYLADILSNASDGLPTSSRNNDFNSQLYKESTFAAYTAINRMHNLQEDMPELQKLSDATISRLVCQMLQRTTIPFHGEPANGLQVMGFLETRNLDFKNVIMLSAGEGQMPRANKRPSLIPYSLQMAFGMTTVDKEVSIYAYYFYRLLQRAENITILWNSSTEDGHKGEMSRFLMQLLVEAEHIFDKEQEIDFLSFTTPSESMQKPIINIEKNEEIMRRLHLRFDLSTEQTLEWIEKHKDNKHQLLLSPSAILCHMKCPLQFFFKYIAGLRPDNDVSEDIDDAVFGDIFHYVMEHIYQPLINRSLTSSFLKDLANNEIYIMRLIDEGFIVKLFKHCDENRESTAKNAPAIKYSGSQLIKRKVLYQLIKYQLEADAQTAMEVEHTGSFQILETEGKHCVVKEILPDTNAKPFNIRIGGIIDRIDMIDNGFTKTIRVVDYKTSSKPHVATNIEQLFDRKKVKDNYHITQTMYYCDVLTQEGKFNADNVPVVPAIMYYKNNKAKESAIVKMNYEGMIKDRNKKPYILDYTKNCKDVFLPLMNTEIDRIFEPGVFTQCENESSCKHCDFKLLCCRNPKDNF
ncbi:MAG: PD-(D/E)XK nuclease family protein [Prevotellaceae bacterium]|nr:PD-(D/E)XK nuclease family protein [Candidatus Minthosoma caballi]